MTQHVALVHYTIQRIAFATCLTKKSSFWKRYRPFYFTIISSLFEQDEES